MGVKGLIAHNDGGGANGDSEAAELENKRKESVSKEIKARRRRRIIENITRKKKSIKQDHSSSSYETIKRIK